MNRIGYLFGGIVSGIVNRRLRFQRYRDGKATVGRDVEGLRHVTFEGENKVARGTIFSREVQVGYATTVGANCLIHGPARIGRYCQLGTAVGIYGSEHPTSHLTTYVNSGLLRGAMKQYLHRKEVAIGHDVWIGHGAVVLKGLNVGNGAIIGAGAIVTSAVPDFAIVVGNPARILRYRFPEEVIDKVQKMQWWEMTLGELSDYEEIFHVDFNSDTERGLELLAKALRRRHA